MRNGISFTVASADRRRLGALVKNRNAPQKHVRTEIVLLTAGGVGTKEIMSQTGKSKNVRLAVAGTIRAGGL